ncbi:MAG: fibronectin type III domain-containing protein [Verrucomicrobiota bacterium]
MNGGKLAIARRDACRETVITQLRELAAFVQMKMKNDITVLLASGFQPVSTNRTRAALPQPVVLRVENGMTGQMILAAQSESNAKSWQVESALAAEDGALGGWVGGDPATDSRRITVGNLIPGRVYAFRLRAVGGTTGFSDWSDPITRRAA